MTDEKSLRGMLFSTHALMRGVEAVQEMQKRGQQIDAELLDKYFYTTITVCITNIALLSCMLEEMGCDTNEVLREIDDVVEAEVSIRMMELREEKKGPLN